MRRLPNASGTIQVAPRRRKNTISSIERLQAKGIKRIGSATRGFRYRTSTGGGVSRPDLERIRKLVLPPAWKNVAINPSPGAALQAIGKDKAGRWQYRYSEAHARRRTRIKFRKILRFAEALPQMRAVVSADMRQAGLPRRKVMASILRLLATCFFRPGSEVYAAENGTVGLATLRKSHVNVVGDRIEFNFPGKSGQRQIRDVRDREVARVIRELKPIPGKEMFQFRNEDMRFLDVKSRHINEYIKEAMGERFSAKDFRTWAGTLICASSLAQEGVVIGESAAVKRKKIAAAVRVTAEMLGNTPAVCRSSYIAPCVFSSFEEGKTISRAKDRNRLAGWRRGLSWPEKSLIRLLRKHPA